MGLASGLRSKSRSSASSDEADADEDSALDPPPVPLGKKADDALRRRWLRSGVFCGVESRANQAHRARQRVRLPAPSFTPSNETAVQACRGVRCCCGSAHRCGFHVGQSRPVLNGVESRAGHAPSENRHPRIVQRQESGGVEWSKGGSRNVRWGCPKSGSGTAAASKGGHESRPVVLVLDCPLEEGRTEEIESGWQVIGIERGVNENEAPSCANDEATATQSAIHASRDERVLTVAHWTYPTSSLPSSRSCYTRVYIGRRLISLLLPPPPHLTPSHAVTVKATH